MRENTKIEKSSDGNWMAITLFVLKELSTGKRILEIITSEHQGGICTTGSIYILTPEGKVGFVYFEDPSKAELETLPDKYPTKLNIQEAHEAFINSSGSFIERIKAIYADAD